MSTGSFHIWVTAPSSPCPRFLLGPSVERPVGPQWPSRRFHAHQLHPPPPAGPQDCGGSRIRTGVLPRSWRGAPGKFSGKQKLVTGFSSPLPPWGQERRWLCAGGDLRGSSRCTQRLAPRRPVREHSRSFPFPGGKAHSVWVPRVCVLLWGPQSPPWSPLAQGPTCRMSSRHLTCSERSPAAGGPISEVTARCHRQLVTEGRHPGRQSPLCAQHSRVWFSTGDGEIR